MSLKRRLKRKVAPTPKHTLEEYVKALGLAVPWVLSVFFRKKNLCILVSGVAAEILRELGFDAKALPCRMVAWNGKQKVFLGWRPDEVSNALREAGQAVEEEVRTQFLGEEGEDGSRPHVIVQVQGKNTPVYRMDLTLSQVQDYGVPVPPTLSWLHEDWGHLPLPEGFVAYSDTVHGSQVERSLEEVRAHMQVPGLDPCETAIAIKFTMQAALRNKLDRRAFFLSLIPLLEGEPDKVDIVNTYYAMHGFQRPDWRELDPKVEVIT